MSRGRHFNHKEKGHEPAIPKHGINVPDKDTKDVQYSIDTVASKGRKPITIIEE